MKRTGPGVDSPTTRFCISHEGRWVTKPWYKRFVAGYPAIKNGDPRQIYAIFHLPAIKAIDEDPETRSVNLHRITQREWVAEMAENYSVLQPESLTTFFPNHP